MSSYKFILIFNTILLGVTLLLPLITTKCFLRSQVAIFLPLHRLETADVILTAGCDVILTAGCDISSPADAVASQHSFKYIYTHNA